MNLSIDFFKMSNDNEAKEATPGESDTCLLKFKKQPTEEEFRLISSIFGENWYLHQTFGSTPFFAFYKRK
jgi:hypothetical protein